MKSSELKRALSAAVQAARGAGLLMRKNLRSAKVVHATLAHDIKLDLDVRCQNLIEKALHKAFPEVAFLGEEGIAGDSKAPYRWVVDPIDGTVNFAYGIPHACVSIALQENKLEMKASRNGSLSNPSVVGVVYDPFCDEMWTAIRGQPALLNGKAIQVSPRRRLSEAVISLGFAKHDADLQKMMPSFQTLVPRVRKVRIMGAAALDLVYVASGRFDAYVECGVRLWDIAAGGLILESAGGEFWHRLLPGDHFYHVFASNGPMRKAIEKTGVSKTS